MGENKVPYLCGGVLFFLLTQATLPDGSARDHQSGVKDEHKEPILMTDLIYTFTGSRNYGAAKDTSKYKDCLTEGGSNIPFDDIAKCTTYENLVVKDYAAALQRMDDFVGWHIDPEMKTWLVKALLEIIENDRDIDEDDILYICADGAGISKREIRNKRDFDLSSFLVGVLHFVLSQRRGMNSLGIPTLDLIGEKKSRKARKYTGHLGGVITRKIEVEFLPMRTPPEPLRQVEDSTAMPAPKSIDDESDDEVIRKQVLRTGAATAAALSAIPKPQIDVEGLAEAIKPFAAAVDSCKLDERQTETLVNGISTIVAGMEAGKHRLAEQIRENSRRESSASSTETPEPDCSSTVHEETRTTIIQKQTNVIQNGPNNVNVTNNGTMNFNFGGGGQ